ncbi:CU044_2847 family protein [Streptomyces sp. NPDC055189]
MAHVPHDEYIEFTLGDGAEVRLELAPVGERPPPPQGDADLPDGIAGGTPVGRGARVGALATDALRTVLSPLGPVLQQVHDAVRSIPDPPHEISVDFGIQVGQDLKIGIVGANGQASMTISATWQLPGERPT